MTDLDPVTDVAVEQVLEPAVVETAVDGLPPVAAETAAAPVQAPTDSPKTEPPFWTREELRKSQKANKRLQADYDRTQRELEELRAQRHERQQPQEPDFDEDPAAFRAHTLREAQQVRENARLDTSELLARSSFGEEAVDELLEWAGTRPDIARWSLTQRHPYAALMQTYKKEKLAAEIGDDPEAWRTAERARLQEQIRAELAAEQGGVNPLATAGQPAPAARIPVPASQRSSATPKAGQFAGPVPLSSVTKNNFG
jgi:hypothetical protein